MNDREHIDPDEHLDRYLSGESSLDDLPPRLHADERGVRDLIATLREDVRAPGSLRNRVMQRIRAERAPAWRRALDWLLRPRTLRLSPAAGGLALAGAAAALALLLSVWPATTGGVMTRFVFVAPEASTVRLTGDFVDWSREGIALEDQRGTGIWTVDVPLEPGVYQYVFVVNGAEWRPDPRAVSSVDDGFGRENSVVIVSDGGET